MKQSLLLFFFGVPLVCFSQNEVGSDGNKLLIIIAVILLLPLVVYLLTKLNKSRKSKQKPSVSFSWRRLKIGLTKNRKYRPSVLTLTVKNVSSKDIDLEAPVLCFQKLWSRRKFKLKGVNRSRIYPLYLEKGKTHELRIDLSVFHQHDRKLRRFYWAKVKLSDTKGRKYSTRRVTLRKSLFS